MYRIIHRVLLSLDEMILGSIMNKKVYMKSLCVGPISNIYEANIMTD